MFVWVALTGCASFCLGVLGCSAIRSFAARRGMFDRPNDRSLHSVPVPRLGGFSIVSAATLTALACVVGAHITLAAPMRACIVASLGIAVLGGADDIRSLPTGVRLVLQLGLALGASVAIGYRGHVAIVNGCGANLPAVAYVALATVWIVGVLNIFNFMDGMDGLAGTQTVFAALAWCTIGVVYRDASLAAIAVAIAAAAAGFLVHNAPPAAIFMGDAGSTFLGFSFATFPLVMNQRAEPAVPFVVGPLALAPFLLDGTYTILRRASNGENIFRAHRTHLYQRAVLTGLGHRDVLVVYAFWTALSCACAVVAARLQALPSAVAIVVPILYGVGVRTWVLDLERKASAKKASAP